MSLAQELNNWETRYRKALGGLMGTTSYGREFHVQNSGIIPLPIKQKIIQITVWGVAWAADMGRVEQWNLTAGANQKLPETNIHPIIPRIYEIFTRETTNAVSGKILSPQGSSALIQLLAGANVPSYTPVTDRDFNPNPENYEAQYTLEQAGSDLVSNLNTSTNTIKKVGVFVALTGLAITGLVFLKNKVKKAPKTATALSGVTTTKPSKTKATAKKTTSKPPMVKGSKPKTTPANEVKKTPSTPQGSRRKTASSKATSKVSLTQITI